MYDHKIDLMKLSDYNKLVKSLHLTEILLDDNQYAYVANYETSVNLENAIYGQKRKSKGNGRN